MTKDLAPQYTVSHCTRTVSELGEITGLQFEETGVTQFLGVPFASIPGRFRKPHLLTSWPEARLDATKLGPWCFQPPRDFYPIPVYARNHVTMPHQDEFEILNLNISLPPGFDRSDSNKLPVMVFIHGGANAYAGNCGGTYDGHVLAANSAKLGEPTIIVVINYRLGPFGWLASRDISRYNESKYGESGAGNYGLWDQHVALKWINRFIGGFGGDKSRVTLFGQSAGSQAAHLQMLKGEPLFSRVILQSGLSPLCGVFSLDQYDSVYYKILQNLNIDYTSLSAEQRVEKLIAADPIALSLANEKVHGIPVVTMAYCDDYDFLPNRKIPSWGDLTQSGVIPEWVSDVMIGDCVNECIIWNKTYKHFNAVALIEYLHSFASSPDVADKIMNWYNINPNLTNKQTFDIIEQLTSDGMYILPNYAFTRANPLVRAYHFNQASHYDNPWKGYAHHSLDNTYVWGVLNHTLPAAAQKLSAHMTQVWLDFAKGKPGWARYEQQQKYKMFGPNDEVSEVTAQDDTLRKDRYCIWDEIIESGLLEEFGRICEDLNLNRREVHGYI